jgi:hypothetical protein
LYLIIIIKDSGDKELLKKVNKWKDRVKKDTEYEKKNANRLFSPIGQLIFASLSYGWMLIVSHIAISGGNILILPIRNI